MLSFTLNALKSLREIVETEEINPPIVRIKVVGGACAGLTNDMSFETVISDLDEILDFEHFKVICDPFSFGYLENCLIDYITSDLTSGFKFIFQDEQVRSCGCGSSFGF